MRDKVWLFALCACVTDLVLAGWLLKQLQYRRHSHCSHTCCLCWHTATQHHSQYTPHTC